jgi:4-amino-4-deoxy-L-arabinose transferase-like glycosyltransferase
VTHRFWLWLILAAYFFIGAGYILLNPLWESPDEIHHFPMVQYLQTHGLQLPSQEEGSVGLWQQEGNQPPLYYILSAILIAPIDTSDIDKVMRVNPHADIGIIRPDGNLNRLVHHPQNEGFLGSGSALASYILRFFSLFLGAATVFVSYYTAKLIFPEKPSLAIGAAGINAFIPMYLYISASVSNDNLSTLLANLLLSLLIRLLLRDEKPSWKSYVLIGLITGMGLLSKLNIGLLIPVVAFVLLVISLRKHDWRPVVFGGLISGKLTILIAGWWYWRNWQLFSDPTGLDRFLGIVGKRVEPATLTQLWTERESFTRTFWGLFGSITVPIPEMMYLIFNTVGLIALISGITVAIVRLREKSHRLAIGLTLLWPILTLIALLRWTSITPASQGRLMYGAISSISLWMAVGMGYWLPERFRARMINFIVGTMAVIATIQPFTTIAPAYNPTMQIQEKEPIVVFSTENSEIAVLDIRLPDNMVQVGDYVEFEVDFELLSETDKNWSLFVHLVSPEGIIIGQRNIYPARGLLATSDLSEGDSWQNPIAVYVPPTTYAPTSVEVQLGWYHLPTGERMLLADDSQTLTIGQVDLLPTTSDFDVPNPQHINFGNQIELTGYDISSLSVGDGETVELKLYWRGLQSMSADYVVFANIIDRQSLTKYADSNAMPVEWTRPTSTWEIGEIIVDRHTLTIRDNAESGIYSIEVGLYLQEDGFPRLPVIGTYDNLVYLTDFRIK